MQYTTQLFCIIMYYFIFLWRMIFVSYMGKLLYFQGSRFSLVFLWHFPELNLGLIFHVSLISVVVLCYRLLHCPDPRGVVGFLQRAKRDETCHSYASVFVYFEITITFLFSISQAPLLFQFVQETTTWYKERRLVVEDWEFRCSFTTFQLHNHGKFFSLGHIVKADFVEIIALLISPDYRMS